MSIWQGFETLKHKHQTDFLSLSNFLWRDIYFYDNWRFMQSFGTKENMALGFFSGTIEAIATGILRTGQPQLKPILEILKSHPMHSIAEQLAQEHDLFSSEKTYTGYVKRWEHEREDMPSTCRAIIRNLSGNIEEWGGRHEGGKIELRSLVSKLEFFEKSFDGGEVMKGDNQIIEQLFKLNEKDPTAWMVFTARCLSQHGITGNGRIFCFDPKRGSHHGR